MPGSERPEALGRLSLPVTAGYSHATALLRGIHRSPATQAPTAEAKEKLVNDRPSPGQYPDPGYDGLSTTTFAGDVSYGSFETQGQGYDYTAYGSHDTGAYDATAWAAATPQESYLTTIPPQSAPQDATGQWSTDYQGSSFGYDPSAEQTGHWSVPGMGMGTTGTETGAYDATAWNSVPQESVPSHEDLGRQFQPEAGYDYPAYEQQAASYEATTTFEAPTAPYEAPSYEATAVFEAPSFEAPAFDAAPYEATATFEAVADDEFGIDVTPDGLADAPAPAPQQDVHAAETMTMSAAAIAAESASLPRSARRAAGKGGGSSRRRTPAKRSALLTVAVPSVCVMGVAGVAAASVSGLTGGSKSGEDTTTMAAPDPASVKPVAANNKLDTQLTALSADAGDFADRASRTQERIDLRERQELEKKKREAEAAAKEAARPKFALPVAQHGLSAGYGQSGVNWMSLHTGIDFPVAYGTPVMAATDGTVRTQWNSAYGNMVILTAPDGTETWYCHLSSAKIRSGKVKAGDVIAYSGNSGNSTGPHLHFEVRPGGGSPIDPSSWLRAHGLNPN
ncbi:M23 family metallopeptidase [Streptomyces sp. WAC06614]|uniref:M23 family metallopeptidase n=1 Tax=Streptomyces sp. WAC06614 TaxID=2487416 RepID=UPI000F79738F|nr:M23 family metallopeptidase [Streptomyces sp. WAC06614]RSS81624.1 M23 family metallopeptidase [Streptomyces sp. WAC06614]